MTTYHLPPGMTADRLRELADDMAGRGVDSLDAEIVSAWADAIDPPKPKPVVTDEMVDAVANEIIRPSFDDGYLSLRMIEGVLTAAIECGWTPPGEGPEPQSYLLSEISRMRLALKVHGIEGGDLGGEVHNLALDNRYVRDRLAMAEGLLRRVTIEVMVWESTGGVPVNGGGWWVGSKDWPNESHKVNVTANEVAYLRSLDGEDDTDA